MNGSAGSDGAAPVSNDPVIIGAAQSIENGRQTFRFDTLGDEAFWGDTLQLHKAIEGAANGGFGPGVSPKAALAVGLKVDATAIPPRIAAAIKAGKKVKKLPLSLGEALDALSEDETIQQALPGEMYRVFMHYKRDEWEKFLATVTELDVNTYLDALP